MASESVLRIRIEDDGGGRPQAAGQGTPPPPPPRPDQQADTVLRAVKEARGGALPADEVKRLVADLEKARAAKNPGAEILGLLDRYTRPPEPTPLPLPDAGAGKPPEPTGGTPPGQTPTARPSGTGVPPRDVAGDALAAAQEVRDRLSRGALTVEEAFARLAKVVAKGGDALTDALRDKGLIDRTRTADDYFRRTLAREADRLGELVDTARNAPAARARRLSPEEAADERRRRAAANDAGTLRPDPSRLDALRDLIGSARGTAGGDARSARDLIDAARSLFRASPPAQKAIEVGTTAAGDVLPVAARAGAAAAGAEGAGLAAGLAAVAPPAAIAAAALAGVAIAAKKTAETFIAFAERGRELAAYSGTLASASAAQDVAALRADLKDARVLGPDLARIVRARTDFQNFARDDARDLQAVVAKQLADLADPLADLVRELRPLRQGVGDAVKSVSDVAGAIVFGPIKEAVKSLADVARGVNKILAKVGIAVDRQKEPEPGDQVDNWADEIDRMALPLPPPNAFQERMDRELKLPILFQG